METSPFKSNPNLHLTDLKMGGGGLALVLKCKNDLFLHKTICCGYLLVAITSKLLKISN